MIDFRNPYTPGAGFMPKHLAGRDEIIERAGYQIESVADGYQSRSVIYYGLRGVGKTVLLNEIEQIADNRNLLIKHIEVKESSNFVKSLSIASTGFAQSLSLKENIKSKAGKLFSVIRSFSATWNPEDKTVSFAMAGNLSEPATAGTGDLVNDFTELLVTLGSYARDAGTAICFFIDEIQYAKADELEAMIAADHRTNQLGLPVLFFCAGLPKILKAMGDAKSYTERLFEFVKIDSLPREAVADAITVPADELGVTYTDGAVDAIFEITNGYPYFVQELCSVVWDNYDGKTINADVVYRYEHTTMEKLDAGFFSVRYERCTGMEKKFMIAMAECGELPCTIANVAAIMGKTVKSVSIYRGNLISKGLIYSTGHGEIDFTVPQFSEFIKRTQQK